MHVSLYFILSSWIRFTWAVCICTKSGVRVNIYRVCKYMYVNHEHSNSILKFRLSVLVFMTDIWVLNHLQGLLDEQFIQLEELQDDANPNFVEEVVTLYYRDSSRMILNIEQSLYVLHFNFNLIIIFYLLIIFLMHY